MAKTIKRTGKAGPSSTRQVGPYGAPVVTLTAREQAALQSARGRHMDLLLQQRRDRKAAREAALRHPRVRALAPGTLRRLADPDVDALAAVAEELPAVRRPRGRPQKTELRKRALELRAEGLSAWKIGQQLYPPHLAPADAYSAAKKLLRRIDRGQK